MNNLFVQHNEFFLDTPVFMVVAKDPAAKITAVFNGFIDKYLSYLFEATNVILAYEAASEGFETESTLSSLCSEILKGDAKNNDHPFYEQVKAFIEARPLKYQESFTRLSICDVMLSSSYLESVYEQYYADLVADIRAFLDIIDRTASTTKSVKLSAVKRKWSI